MTLAYVQIDARTAPRSGPMTCGPWTDCALIADLPTVWRVPVAFDQPVGQTGSTGW